MEDNIYRHNLGDDDVLTFERDESTFRGRKIKQSLRGALEKKRVGYELLKELEELGIEMDMDAYKLEQEKWFIEGEDCEIMKAKEPGWKKAKFRIKMAIEVWSEEPETSEQESPLDDLRQKLSDES